MRRARTLTVEAFERVFEGRLEPLAEVHDEIGIGELSHLSGRELEVMRLNPAGCETADLDLRTANLLDGELKWIERGYHQGAVLSAS